MSFAKDQKYSANVEQAAFGSLLSDIAKAVQKMPEDQFRKLVEGELRPKISFEERHRPPRIHRIESRESSIGVTSGNDLHDIRARLNMAQTREAGHRIVLDAFPERERLLAFARFLDLPVRKGDKTASVREKIVAFTVGRRLSGEAVRGGYNAM